MAQEYDNTNSILVTKNDKKGNDKAPDYRITLDVDGSPFTGGLWLRTSEKFASEVNPKGNFMSGKVEPKRTNVESIKPVAKRSDPMEDLESDIPFANPYARRIALSV